MTNLSNAKAVWGEDSEQYQTMKSIASSYQKPNEMMSAALGDKISVKKGVEDAVPAASFSNLVYRSKPA